MKKTDDLLARHKGFEKDFMNWFDSGLSEILEDNRRRYRMVLEDAEEREERGLSALPSTKSCSAVDRAVERAIMEYHGDPDAISFTAKPGAGTEADNRARWLSEVFKYRANRTFPFAVWHISSLTACFADGIECAMASWRKEAYKEKVKAYYYNDPLAGQMEVPEEAFVQLSQAMPGLVEEGEKEVEVVCRDTFWIDQLRPGEDVLWDIKAPLLDMNMGQAVMVKLPKSGDELKQMAEDGIIDKIDDADLEAWLKPSDNDDVTVTTFDTAEVDFGDLNRAEVWVFFEKIKKKWHVSFSIEGKHVLGEPKPLNDVWYGGRKVNKLPVVIGTSKLKLWENVGRGIPETIAPIEDEWTDHRNNLNDAAKLEIQGRWRVNSNADIDLDQLLNSRVFFARPGEAEQIQNNFNLMSSLRAADSVQQDMQELIPVGMEGRQVVPKGTDKTLGALEMALSSANEKLNVSLLTRNITFMRPLLEIVAELIISFETDEGVLRAAGAAVKDFRMPQAGGVIDLKGLDVGYDVQINAGLGSVPRQHKIQMINSLITVGAQAGLPVDILKGFKQATVLAGFDEEYFLLPEDQRQQPEPKPEMKATVNIDLALLPPQIQMALIQSFVSGSQEITARVKGDMPKPDFSVPPMNGGMARTAGVMNEPGGMM